MSSPGRDPQPEPQPVLTPLTEAAVILVLTVAEGGEATVRDLLADSAGIGRSVGFRIPEGDLKLVIGSGSDLWDRVFGGPRPAELHPFVPLQGPRHTAPSTPGDLVFHIRARRMDLCFELGGQLTNRLKGVTSVVDETHGFTYFDERDLMGFVDGTENPTGPAAWRAATVPADADPGFAGGSYLIVQKYLHDLDAWNAVPVEEQGRVIGRSKLDNLELPDDVRPANSHVALNTIVDENGEEQPIVRDNMPFGKIGTREFGTYVIGYSGTPAVTEQMLRNMFLGSPPRRHRPHPRLLDGGHRQPVLHPHRRLPGRSSGAAGRVVHQRQSDGDDENPPVSGSLDIGSPKRSPVQMNNPYRELAPVSEAA